MHILKIDTHKTICDEIRYELKDKTFEFIEFYLDNKVVLSSLTHHFIGQPVDTLKYKITFISADAKVKLFLSELFDKINKDTENIKLKQMIFKQKYD